MKWTVVICALLAASIGVAQEIPAIKLQLDRSKISPVFNASQSAVNDLHLDTRLGNFSDSLAVYQLEWRNDKLKEPPRFNYDTNPYSRDRASGGVIARLGNGYMVGAGSHTTYPGLGDMASANVAFSLPMGERLLITAGVTGNKYHFDRVAWNDYGVFGNASFRLNNSLSLNIFGQYYINQQFHSAAAMPFLGGSSYGGTLGWRASDNFSLDLGARRIYDPYTGRWRTLPVVQPTFNLLGAPISFDAGPVIFQLLDGLFGSGKDKRDWGDPRYRPVAAPGAVNSQPGFNPNSPVPIPDVFRH